MSTRLFLPALDDDPEAPFPPTSDALDEPNGLLAGGGDLSPPRLLNAYSRGIFPWYTEGSPILWWSPAPRCVIFPDKVYLSRRTCRRYNTGAYRLSLNQAFAEVIHCCAEPRDNEPGTWITAEMERAYCELHRLGRAHSLEVWKDGELAGGIYGLAIGAAFFGESMFSRAADGSKIALVALCRLLLERGLKLLDCQVGNPHLFSMGAEELSREPFETLLRKLVAEPDCFPGASPPAFGSRWQAQPRGGDSSWK
jgi:leucyl/phenylalanyl-tRNA--protein transferase